MTLLFLYDYQRMTCDVRLQVVSCDVRSQVGMCGCEPTLVVSCDVRACGAFLGVRSAIAILHVFWCILHFCGLKTGGFIIFI